MIIVDEKQENKSGTPSNIYFTMSTPATKSFRFDNSDDAYTKIERKTGIHSSSFNHGKGKLIELIFSP